MAKARAQNNLIQRLTQSEVPLDNDIDGFGVCVWGPVLHDLLWEREGESESETVW